VYPEEDSRSIITCHRSDPLPLRSDLSGSGRYARSTLASRSKKGSMSEQVHSNLLFWAELCKHSIIGVSGLYSNMTRGATDYLELPDPISIIGLTRQTMSKTRKISGSA
jgi:hypothetical protein